MIKQLRIEGYRGLAKFAMSDLSRVNLIVGTNNSGKTSVLEAINLLSSAGDPASLWLLLSRRGEQLPPSLSSTSDRAFRRSTVELDVSHLFAGHEANVGSTFRISANNEFTSSFLTYTIIETQRQIELPMGAEEESDISTRLALEVTGEPKPPIALLPLSRNAGLYYDAIQTPIRRARQRSTELESYSSRFITTESFTGSELAIMWNRIALTPNESLVLRALQFLDSDIERIAAQVSPEPYLQPHSKGGFIVKRKGWEQPVPIGSMGDGMWRMLAMAIAITQCRGGVLLVDEIDTGLHYSVMSQMWRLIYNAAKELDVQVFATTHSYDCLRSIAELCSEAEGLVGVTVQRVERASDEAVRYSTDEIVAAAGSNIELR